MIAPKLSIKSIARILCLFMVVVLVSSCNKDEEENNDSNNNSNNNGNSSPAGVATLKLYYGGSWKTYDLTGDTKLDKGDCFGSWEEYVGFGIWDGVTFWLGDQTAANSTFNYLEDDPTLCEYADVSITSFGDIASDLEDHYGVPVYSIIDTNGDGQFSISNLANNKISMSWSGNVTIRVSTFYDVLAVIPATFTVTNEPYEDLR
jgi:hypothetical protein